MKKTEKKPRISLVEHAMRARGRESCKLFAATFPGEIAQSDELEAKEEII